MHFLQFNSTPNESDDERAQTIDRASTQHDNVENERHDLNLSGGEVLAGHVGDQEELLAGNVDEGEVQVDQHQEVFLF